MSALRPAFLALVLLLGHVLSGAGVETAGPLSAAADFDALLARARAEGRPLVIVGGAPFCGYCMRAKKAFATDLFQAWAASNRVLLAETRLTRTNATPGQAAAAQFVRESPCAGDCHQMPLVAFYHVRGSNDELRVMFSGRRGSMPGRSCERLEEQFISAFETISAPGYQQPPPPPRRRDFAPRHVQAAAEGPGTVAMEPADGVVAPKVGMVVLTATAGANAVFVGWKGPDGAFIKRWRRPKLHVRYAMPEGVYTAVFQSQTEENGK